MTRFGHGRRGGDQLDRRLQLRRRRVRDGLQWEGGHPVAVDYGGIQVRQCRINFGGRLGMCAHGDARESYTRREQRPPGMGCFSKEFHRVQRVDFLRIGFSGAHMDNVGKLNCVIWLTACFSHIFFLSSINI